MANKILTADGWEKRIQDKLGVDPAYLPDEVIRQPDAIGIAEENIIKQISDYGSLKADAKLYLEAAVVCECAALLCSSMPVRLPKKEQGPHATHELSIDWTEKKQELEIDRDRYISKVIEIAFPEQKSSTLLHFRVTKPVRW